MSPIAAYGSRVSGAGAGVWPEAHLSRHHRAVFICVLLASAIVFVPVFRQCRGAENDLPPPTASQPEDTNSQAVLQTYLQLQEQLQAAHTAIEQSRRETREAAAQTADALSNALQTIQEAFDDRRGRDLEAMRSANQVMLVVVGTFAAMSFLSMLMMSYFQWRMTKGLAQISATLPVALGLDPGSFAAALARANQPELPLFGATGQPEQRGPSVEPSAQAALRRHGGARTSVGNRRYGAPEARVHSGRFRTVSVAVIVGLLCAAALALVLYAVAYRKFGFG